MSLVDLPFADLLQLSTLTLATLSPACEPHAAPVYFAVAGDAPDGTNPALRFYFFSDPLSLHAQDLACDPRAAATLYPETEHWQDIRGLQMRGEAIRVDPGPDWDQAWKDYQARFPFVADLKDVVASNALYVFIPHWIRLVDNRRGFGFKQEWTMA